MKINQVALQLYTLREFCKTAADYAATLKKVRAAGYESIQLSGVSADIPMAEVRHIADNEGLTISSSHDGGDFLLETPELVVEKLDILDAKYTAYPFPGGFDFTKPEDIDRLIAKLNHAGAVLKNAGKVLCYHNHVIELTTLVDGKPLLEVIYDRTDPEYLQGEPDTAWINAVSGAPHGTASTPSVLNVSAAPNWFTQSTHAEKTTPACCAILIRSCIAAFSAASRTVAPQTITVTSSHQWLSMAFVAYFMTLSWDV